MEENKEVKKDLTIRRADNTAVGMFPEDAEGVYRISIHLAKSDLCPKSFGQNPANVFAAIMMGRELGIGAMQAMSNIAVVNGRASIWGELATALIRSSDKCAKLVKKVEGSGTSLKVTLIGRRTGDTEDTIEEYTWADAVAAGNSNKDTYQKYPKDMLYYKCLHRLGKFLWPDVLKGISIQHVEEDLGFDTAEVVTVEVEPAKPAEPTAEELLKKAEEAKARVAAEEAKEKAKAEKKAAKVAKPEPVPAVSEGVPAATEEEMAEEPAAEVVPVNRAVGTLIGAFKLSDTKTAAPIGFCIKVQTADGEQKFKVASHEEATALKALKDKTVCVIWEKLVPAIDGLVGKCVKCEGTSK